MSDIHFVALDIVHDKKTPVYYSAPTQSHTDADVDRFIVRLAQLQRTSWIWILDCRASWITTNPAIVYRLKQYFEQHHEKSLQAVFVVNISGWMRRIFGMLPTKKLRILPSEPLELFVTMSKEGYSSDLVSRLMKLQTNVL